MQEIPKRFLNTNMTPNISEKFVQDCTRAYNFDYVEIVYFLVIVSAVIALYYVCYCRYCYASYPSCSLECFLIYVRLTGRYLGELPVTTGKVFLCLISGF